LIPALYHLKRANLLPDDFALVGISRTPQSDEQFRDRLGKSLRELSQDPIDDGIWDWFAQRMHYMAGSLDDSATYERLKTLLLKMDADHHSSGNYLFYMAVPAAEFAPIVQHLGAAGLAREDNGQWRRVVVEKPFGNDLKSAKALNRVLLENLTEPQIYRIDHYLGKETVQNIMVLRFGNGLFEPLWNRNHIDHVEITVAETLGVERRGRYYDATGALRDMVPNHLFQLLTLTAMEPPTCFEADATRNEKGKVLDAIRRFTRDSARQNAVRAQYGRGSIQGKTVASYREEPDVDPNSVTATYVAIKLTIENWRWAGVPFYLRTGKALAARHSEILIQFKQAPLTLFHSTPVERLIPNDLTLNIQPEEGASLRFGAKVPGQTMQIGDVEMKFNYGDYFRAAPSNGYETLLYDCMMGDASLFQRADTIESAWGIIQPVLDNWTEDRVSALPVYAAGSQGPAEADALLQRDGRGWRPIRTPADKTPAGPA
jgi:glucose-6-phosphate 1-dehydrogenase